MEIRQVTNPVVSLGPASLATAMLPSPRVRNQNGRASLATAMLPLPRVRNQKVAIVGGGIGGLATAVALRKQGIDAHVYEKARELRPVGAGLTLFPNGLKSLDAIAPGIVEKLKEKGSQICTINLKTAAGEMLQTRQIEILEKYGQPILCISWYDLQQILASLLPPEIIHLDRRCIGFAQNRDRLKVNFEGEKTIEADLLIGADGINSAVRQALVGDGSPCYRGRMSWRALIKYSHELLPVNQGTNIIAENKIVFLLDSGGGSIYWSLGTLSPDVSMSGSPAEIKSRVLAQLAGWASPVPEIIEATDAEAIVERRVGDRLPLSCWSRGRVTLLGDAAHAMVTALGQGGNTTFEDAWELSYCLSHADSLETALNNYERSPRERTQTIQARSALAGYRTYNPDFSLQDLEKEFGKLSHLVEASVDEFNDWLYGYDPVAIAQNIAANFR